MSNALEMWRQYICRACGLVYDEQKGDPDSGLAPGTRFEDIPDDWSCPLCGVVKSDFEPFEPVSADQAQERAHVRDAYIAHRRGGGIVIVGGGIAGWSVAESLRKLDPDVPITLVTACTGDRYHKPELSIALSRRLDPEKLVRETAVDAAHRLRVKLMADTFAIGIATGSRQLRTTRGPLRYSDLILAQGAKPALPPSLPANLCWRINDLAGWTGLQRRLKEGPRRVAIVGAGMVGCELAEDFSRAGHTVTLIDLSRQPLGGLLPPHASERLQMSFAAQGILFSGQTQVREVFGTAGGVKQIGTVDGRIFVCDEIVAATGLATESRLARGASLDFDRGIVVDPLSLRTSAEHIYALGDCISIDGAPCRFIEPLARQASAIAHSVLNLPGGSYAHRPPVIRLKTKSLSVVVHGQPCTDGQWLVVEDGPNVLRMQQKQEGTVVAELEMSTPQQRLAA